MREENDVDTNESEPTKEPHKHAAYIVGGSAAALLVLLMIFQTSC